MRGLIAGVVLLGGVFLVTACATAQETVANANTEINEAADIVVADLGNPTVTEDWTVGNCLNLRAPDPPRTERRIASRSVEWHAVPVTEARTIIELIADHWRDKETRSVYVEDIEQAVISAQGRNDGFTVYALYWYDDAVLSVGASTHCGFSESALREAF